MEFRSKESSGWRRRNKRPLPSLVGGILLRVEKNEWHRRDESHAHSLRVNENSLPVRANPLKYLGRH